MDIVERLRDVKFSVLSDGWSNTAISGQAADAITSLREQLAKVEAERDDLQQQSWGLQDKIASLSAHETCACAWDKADDVCLHHSPKLTRAEAMCADLAKALEPFAKAGQVIDGPFGPALFAEDDMAFQSGCAWSENGERRTITWGDFRRALAALASYRSGGSDE